MPRRNIRDAAVAGLVAGGLFGTAIGSTFEVEGRLVVPLFSLGVGVGVGALLGAISR